MNRLLTRLDHELASATDLRQRLLIRIRRVAVRARMGQFEDAERDVAGIRAANAVYDPGVSIWLMLAEGIVEHFKCTVGVAGERLRRAHALALQYGDADLLAACSAWLAAARSAEGRYADSLDLAYQALVQAPADAHATRARAMLVIADGFSWGGERGNARLHYQQVRDHASHDGDITMQSAALFNAVSFHVTALLVVAVVGDGEVHVHPDLERELASIDALDRAANIRALDAFIPLLRAELLGAKAQWHESLEAFEAVLPRSRAQGQGRLSSRYLAQMANAAAALGEVDMARRLIAQATNELGACSSLDDRVISLGGLARAAAALGDATAAAQRRAQLLQAHAAYRQAQAHMRQILRATAPA